MEINLIGSHLDISDEAINVLRGISIDLLDIPKRGSNALLSQGVDNALSAIEIINSGFVGIKGIGEKTKSECAQSVRHLLDKIKNIEPDLILNIIDSRESYFEHANGNVIQVFHAVVDLYFDKKSNNKERNQDFLCKRFNLDNKGTYTLEDIGTYYDLTRERVRQVEAKTINDLDLLLSGTLKTKNWRLDSRLIDNYHVLKKHLDNKDFILSSIEIGSVLSEVFGCAIDNGYFCLFMEILGYIRLPTNIDGFRGTVKNCWCKSDRFSKKEIESIFQALDIIFDYVDPISKFDLTVKAKKKAKKKITNESIHIALKSCEEIEVDDEMISIKFNYLRSAADKAYRLLSSKNKPIHYSDLCKEINLIEQSLSNSAKPITQTNLKNQLVSDKKFKPIGKSGEWSLAKWSDFENVTIVQAIESVLHKSGSPLSFFDIAKGVKEIRPDASRRSFIVYLTGQSHKFMKVGDDLYALSSWKMTPHKKRRKTESITNEVFYEVVKDILEQSNPIPFPEFFEKMKNKTGLKEVSIRQRVNSSPIIHTRNTKKRYKEVYCETLDFNLEKSGLIKSLLRDRVQNEIRSILYETPNVPIKKGDLYALVKNEVPCQKSTFYQYLEKTSDIRQYKENNLHYAVYDHLEESNKIEVNFGEYNLDSHLIAKLIRPVSMLDIENVDIALFELGLIFENTLKEYLIEARSQAKINITHKDMRKLATMINCVVREGVVTKGHHLSTLREERNNRAHGNQPSTEERNVLFNKAHYVAELFIRYIALFHKKQCELTEI